MNRSSRHLLRSSHWSRGGVVAGLLCLGALGGCGSDPTYYQVTSVAGAAQAGGPSPIEVRSVSFPSALDRDQIVTRAGERLTLDPHAAWSEAPAAQIGRALTSDLAQRLPGSTVFLQGSATSSEPELVVELNVTQFSADDQGQAVLGGTLGLRRRGALGAPQVMPLNLTAPAGSRTQTLVGALSGLIGQLADQAANRIRAIPANLSPPS